MSDELRAEFGSSLNFRFLDDSQVTLYDGDDNTVLCSCGRKAGSGVFGKEAFAAWCSSCSPLNKTEASFVYKSPRTDL